MSTLPLLPLVHSYERNPWSSVIRDESRERLITKAKVSTSCVTAIVSRR
jgi:hypothetical protein